MRKSSLALLPLLLAACATGGGGGGAAVGPGAKAFPATYKLPAPNAIDGDVERQKLADALKHLSAGETARASGSLDEARVEWRIGGEQLVGVANYATGSEYRLVYRATGARFLLQAGEFDAAAQAAEAVAVDPAADGPSRAFAGKVRLKALSDLASQEVRAGKLEPLSFGGADKRKAKDLKPRPVSPTWRRLVDAADAYALAWKADEDPAAAAESAASAGYQAGAVMYTFDNLEEAGRRFLAVLEGFPASRVSTDAAQLYLQTFLVRDDQAGYAAGLDKVLAVVGPEARRAAEAAKKGDADVKAHAEAMAKLEEQVLRQKQGSGFAQASKLLAEGKSAEAAAAFEKFAAENPTSGDAAAALYNAGIAWAGAKQPAKARAVRDQLVAAYPTDRLAAKATLATATDLGAAGDHAGAAQRYLQYVEKNPAGEERCLALQNAGAELDAAKKPLEAARQYVAFGTDGRCVKEDPNTAAKLLYRAAALFNTGKKDADTKKALAALVGLSGVTDPVAKSYVEDAKKRVK